MWKNLLGASPLFRGRTLALAAAAAVGGGTLLGAGEPRSAWAPALGLLAGQLLVFSLLFGALAVRCDFRQDLKVIALLKTYPLPGWQIVLGELLAPAAVLTAAQWLLLLFLVSLLGTGHAGGAEAAAAPWPAWGDRLSGPLSLAVVAPAYNLLSLLLPNAAALFLPSWFPHGPGSARGRGLETTGQSLIFLCGQLLLLAAALLPAAGVAAMVFLAAQWLGAPGGAALVGAALAAALVLAGEVALALSPLGELFERLDAGEERLLRR